MEEEDYIPARLRDYQQPRAPADIQLIDPRGLYLGSAAGRYQVRALGIRRVQCLMTRDEYGRASQWTDGRPWVWFDAPKDADPADVIHETHFPLDDDETEDIRPVLDVALPTIERALDKGERVLVHCAAGLSRSATVILAFLMRRDGLATVQQALVQLRAIRPAVMPNPAFCSQLSDYMCR